ncbi:hypothetical protein JCM3774_001896 [Rhodotorula dairenensis]
MPDSPSESDYGSELDWTDTALDAALTALEQRASSSSLNPPPTTDLDAVIGTPSADASAVQAESNRATYASLAADVATTPAEKLVEEPATATAAAAAPTRSLWERYRQRRGWGALSVSDLSGPSWCEVQHTYRLASKPFLPPLERPATITTSAGAVIQVDATRTVKRESILDRGKEVHRRIEKQVMGDVEEVKVNVTGKEEWWALRILNTVICLHTLLEKGKVRELPVVGWLGGHLVFGVIDEVERREIVPPPPEPAPSPSKAPATPKRRRRTEKARETPEKDDQRKLDQFFQLIRSPAKPGGTVAGSRDTGPAAGLNEDKMADESGGIDAAAAGPPPVGSSAPTPTAKLPTWGYLLSDTKTRFNRSIPHPAESRPARLQLMLYHRLLSAMLGRESTERDAVPECSSSADGRDSDPAPALSWHDLFAHLSLSPSTPLSDDFLESVAPVISDSGIRAGLQEATTLEQFVQVLLSYGKLLRRGRDAVLLDELEIVYRLRHENGRAYANRRGKRRARNKAVDAESPPQQKPAVSRDRAASAAMHVEDTDLQLAIAVSLSEIPKVAKDEPPAMAMVDSPASSDATAQSDLDKQLEDSQLPFFANPSLPIPLLSSPSRASQDDCAALSLPGSAFALPNNSQAAASSTADEPGLAAAARPRYNLRRRRARSVTAGPAPDIAPPPPHEQPAPPVPPSPQTPAQPLTPPDDSDLIGVDTFEYTPGDLDLWLDSVLAYWNGRRPPEGVALAQVNRCRSCEFEDGCEWREMKAQQLLEETQARKRAREQAQSKAEEQ